MFKNNNDALLEKMFRKKKMAIGIKFSFIFSNVQFIKYY